MTPRPSLRPFTKACPIHPDCTLVLCRVTLQSDLPAGAALATTVPGIMPGVFLWAASRPVAGHDEATLDAFNAVRNGRTAHPVVLCSVAEWQAACDAREAGRG
jgi:hypothetical protein